MAAVTMPDGAVVDMPDQIDPALGARLRAFHTNYKPEPQRENPLAASGGQGDKDGPLGFLNGLVELAAKGMAGVPHGVLHGAADLVNTMRGKPEQPDGKFLDAINPEMSPNAQNVAQSLSQNVPTTVQDLVKHYVAQHNPRLARVAGDVAQIAPVAAPFLGGAGGAAAAEDAAAAAPTAVAKYGLRTGAQNPIARNIAGESARPAVTEHNQAIADPAIGAQAGVAPGMPLNAENLKAAQAAPNSVYSRAEAAIPTGPLSPNAAQAVQSIGADDLVTHSPDVQATVAAQKARLLSGDLTGPQVVNTSKALRFNGFKNIGSDDPEQVALGKAQLKMSDALHQHMVDTIPADADVSADQLVEARRALAQNYTVGSLLKGNNVDLQALARFHRNNPGLLSGPLKDFAEFADLHPEVSSLPSKAERFNPSGVAHDIASIDLKSPITYTQPLFGAAARRVLTGPARAPQVPVTGLGGEFGPIDRTPPSGPTGPGGGLADALTNNASGESAASVEAQNRPKLNLEMVGPDGTGEPILKDVTQADIEPRAGHLIIDRSTGQIVKSGNMKPSLAQGLLNRWKAMQERGGSLGMEFEPGG